MAEIKNCPFCGGKAELCEGMGEKWVRCGACGASGGNIRALNLNVVESWNRRVEGKANV